MHGLQHLQVLACHSSVSSSKAFLQFRKSYNRRERPRAVSAEQHAEPPENVGNPNVQQKLMDIIRVQIGQEKVKDFVKVEREKLRQAAEEVQMRPLFVWYHKSCFFTFSAYATLGCLITMFIACYIQAKEEVDELSKLTRDRSNLAFDSATVSQLCSRLA